MTSAGQHVANRSAEIQLLLSDAEAWASIDAKLGAHLAAYLTVLITGMVEDCIEKLVIQRGAKPGDIEIKNYISKSIEDGFRNPDHGKISGILKQFSTAYQDEFRLYVPHDGKAAEALNSIVENKNSLAHKGISSLQMTVRDVHDYYARIVPIFEALEKILA